MNGVRVARGHIATVEQIRAVWAHVTCNRLATVRAMSTELHIPRTKIHYILKFLEGSGYIKSRHGCTGRTVLIPLADGKRVKK